MTIAFSKSAFACLLLATAACATPGQMAVAQDGIANGPVQTQQLVLAPWQTRSDGFRLHFGIEPDRACQLLEEEGTHVRGFLGYSGWSAGQLENEMRANTWIVADVPEDLLSHSQDDSLWRTVLGREGAEWRLLADEPEDPGVN